MRKILIAAVALSVLATAGVANAQPRQDRGDRYEQRHDRQDNRDRRDNGYEQRGDRRDGPRADRDNRNDNRYERRADRRFQAGRYQAPRGYQAHQWRRGERLPAAYRGKGYVVDHRRYGLNAPPRGYQYVRVGNDAALTAISTGVIAAVILQMFQ